MKLLYVIKGLGLGGAEQHVAQCAVAMANRGHQVQVAYLLPQKDHFAARLQDQGIAVTCVGGEYSWWRGLFSRMKALLTEFGPAVVHAHLPVSGMLMRAFKLRGDFRLVYTEHITQQLLHPMTRLAHRATWHLDDVAVSCSQGVADSLSRPSVVVDNGLAADPPAPVMPGLRELLGLAASARVWLCVANFRPQKNHVMLLRAFDRVISAGGLSHWHLALIGQDASERRSCEALAASLSCRMNIHFMGVHDNAAALMNQADGFCLSSIEEGLPIALLEAMRAGLPALVTDVGGMPQVLSPNSGRVVRSRDEDAFVEAMLELSRDESLRKALGEGARERFLDAYTERAMLDRLESLYAGAD